MKRLVYIFSLAFLLFSMVGKAQSRQELKANKFLSLYDLPKAIDQYERLAAKGNQAAMEQLGQIHLKLRNYKEAGKWFSQAEELGPLSQDALYDRALWYHSIGERDSALLCFSAHARQAGDDARSKHFARFLREIPAMPVDSQSYEIVRMPFNSKYSDFGPAAYQDGLIFCSERPNAIAAVTHVSATSGTPLLNLYFTRPTDSTFQRFEKPRNIDWGLSSRFHEGPVAVNEDSSAIYFTRTQLAGKGESKLVEIHRAERKAGKWGKSEVLEMPGFEDASYGYPALSPDGRYLYFSGKKGGESGNWDLYSVRIDRAGELPVNLGSRINTAGNELMPFVHPDGTLYFASDGLPGFGGMDLFTSVKFGGEWQTPLNLNRPVNSSYDDFSCWITDDKKHGFFASNRASKDRNDDIYRFSLNRPIFKDCPYQEKDSYCYLFYDEGTPDTLPNKTYFEWDMGDGTIINDLKAKHCFAGPGTYLIQLNIIDSVSRNPVMNQTAYEFEIENIEQPYITTLDTGRIERLIPFHAKDCNLPEMDIHDYYWDFGDGATGQGIEVAHQFGKPGKYTVQLGLKGKDLNTGLEMTSCVLKDIEISNAHDSPVVAEVSTSLKTPDPPKSIFKASQVDLPNFRIQLGTSLSPVDLKPDNFKGLENVMEIAYEEYYRYIYGSEPTLDSAFLQLRHIQSLGYDNAVVLVFREDSLVETQPFLENWLPGEDFDFTTVRGNIETSDSVPLPASARIIWEDLATGEKVIETKIDPTTGNFLQDVPKGLYYGYYSDINGYFPLSHHIDLNESLDDLVLDDTMRMVSVQELLSESKPVRMNNIFFDTDKADLKPESHRELYRVARFLMENPNLQIEIAGHTDDQGAEEYNKLLSRKRASAVAQFLVLANSGASSISVQGYGESRPLVSNETASGRKLNRRVEFRIIIAPAIRPSSQ